MGATQCGRRWAGWAVLLVMAIAPAAVLAQVPYPNQAIRMIVPVPAGGGVDLLARAISQKMSANLGVPVVVENKPGASAAIGTDRAREVAADGYTILMAYSAHATNPIFNRQPAVRHRQGLHARSTSSASSR